jgi:methylmalonyl-CoA mutase N-terminal domain/subunit
MESHLDEAIDAMAGSYYLETLTRQLGEKVWERIAEL